ncbi:MAG: alpha/beta fold hydrolase [Xanthomonadales bacterium]|nr:alpha/beta fold hydrolase [Xanthomonadales bacterium]
MAMTAVLVHGAGGGGWQWQAWAPVLARAGFAVLAPDLRPCAAGLAATTFDHYQDQVDAWCASAGKELVLIGASLGALLALRAAGPHQAAALVLVNPVPPAGIRPWPAFPERPSVVAWSAGPLHSTVRALPGLPLDHVRAIHRRWRDESGQVLAQAAAGVPGARLACPVLVLAGAEDTDIPPATSQAVAGALRGACLVLAGQGHLSPLLGAGAASVATLAADWLALAAGTGNSG